MKWYAPCAGEGTASLLSQTTQMRTWYAAPDRYRFAVLSTGNEHDVFHDQGGEYLWDYGQHTFTETPLGAPPSCAIG